MRHSIRVRFTCLIFSVLAVLVGIAFILNTWGLEGFYRAQKVKDIERAYASINTEVMRNGNRSARISQILNAYSDIYNITIAVMDSADSSLLQSTERGSSYLFRRAQKYLFNGSFRTQTAVLAQTENYTIISAYDDESDAVNIDCFAYCGDNQTMLLMTTPVSNLKESVILANRFLSYIGLLILLVGALMVFFMTRQITRPIQRLAALSKKMGGLDFSERYCGKSRDEIGVLGSNMNAMAEKLEETIRKLKEANTELQEDIRRKEEIDEMRKAFIANVSHELKTPIALIQGYAEGLDDGVCEDPENRRYYLNVIIDEAGKMNSLVKQLLTLSKLESGAPELSRENFDLTELVRGVLHATKMMAENQGASVRAFFVDAVSGEQELRVPVLVNADEFKIEEVLTNYISNALHHVNEGGSIAVSVEPREERIRLAVYNTGSSIPEEDLPHLWDKFYKVDKAHSRTYGGSGIGLSIVKAIMEAHGMPYGVENCPGGVRFFVELEAVKSEAGNHNPQY